MTAPRTAAGKTAGDRETNGAPDAKEYAWLEPCSESPDLCVILGLDASTIAFKFDPQLCNNRLKKRMATINFWHWG
jgi:hypothetical protein